MASQRPEAYVIIKHVTKAISETMNPESEDSATEEPVSTINVHLSNAVSATKEYLSKANIATHKVRGVYIFRFRVHGSIRGLCITKV